MRQRRARGAGLLALLALAVGMALPAGAAPAARPATHPIQKALYAYGDAARGDRWTGSDGAYSVVLPDGRTVWLLGDTFLGTVNKDRSRAPQGFIHNSWVVQERDGRFGRTYFQPGGLFGTGRAWANPPDDATWYWPGDATVVGTTLQQLLFRISGAGPVFGVVGVDVATYSLPSLSLGGIAALPAAFLPSAQVGGGGPIQFGVAIVETPDFVYVYGCEDWALDKHLHVARVRRGQPLTSQWEHWNGSAWTTNPVTSARLLSGIANEMSVVRAGSGFRLVAQDRGIGRDIYVATAARPEGPWGGRTRVYTTPENPAQLMTYNAKEHPQLSRPGRLVISYNVNAAPGNGNGLYSNVDNYRPRFVTVPYG